MCSCMKFNYGECLELGYCLEFDFRVLKYIVVRNYDIFMYFLNLIFLNIAFLIYIFKFRI